MDEGYIVIATGGEYHSHLAANLALSIRRYDQKRGLAIVIDDAKQFNPYYKILFNSIIEKGDISSRIGTSLKLDLDHFSPFDRTLYVDSDSLLFRNPDPLWASLNGMSVAPSGYVSSDPEKKMFECHMNGKHSFKTVRELSVFSRTEKIMATDGYILYFENSPMADRFFSLARELYAGDQLSEISYPYKHEGEWTDEPLFSVAASRLGIFSPMPAYKPFRMPSVGINNAISWSFDLDHSEFAVAKVISWTGNVVEKVQVISGFFCHFPSPLRYKDYMILANRLRQEGGIPSLALES